MLVDDELAIGPVSPYVWLLSIAYHVPPTYDDTASSSSSCILHNKISTSHYPLHSPAAGGSHERAWTCYPVGRSTSYPINDETSTASLPFEISEALDGE